MAVMLLLAMTMCKVLMFADVADENWCCGVAVDHDHVQSL